LELNIPKLIKAAPTPILARAVKDPY